MNHLKEEIKEEREVKEKCKEAINLKA